MQEVFLKVSKNTSCHGIPHYADAESRKAKVFWIIVMIAAFGAIVYYEWTLIAAFLENPQATVITEVQVESMLFPNVTVCNLGAFSMRNYMPKWDQVKVALRNSIGSVSDPVDFLGYISKLLGTNLDAVGFDGTNYTEIAVMELQYQLLFNISYRQSNPKPPMILQFDPSLPVWDIQEFFKSISLNSHQIFALICFFATSTFDCGGHNSVPVLTPLGQCFQVTAASIQNISGLPLQTEAGSTWGLEMALWSDPNDVPLIAKGIQAEGFQLVFGDSKTWYDRSVVTLIPGYYAQVALQPSKYVFDPAAVPCLEEPPDLIFSDKGVSSIPMCQQECAMLVGQYFCNCFSIYPNAKVPSDEICSPLQLFGCYYLSNLSANMTFRAMVTQCQTQKCQRMCESWSYQPYTIYSGMDTRSTGGMTWEGSNASKVTKAAIYFNEMKYTLIEVTPLMTFNDLVAGFGGNLGLFAGISVVTIIHFFSSIVDVCVKRWKKKTTGERPEQTAIYPTNKDPPPVFVRPVYIP